MRLVWIVIPILLIASSISAINTPDSFGLIMGHPMEFWDSADIILDGTVISTTNIDSENLVQHDVKIEKIFKNEKLQQMITIYGPDMNNEHWFYPIVFEQGDRVLFYLLQVDEKYIILEHSRKATEQCTPRSMIGLSTLPGEPMGRGGPTLFFNPYQTCNGFLTPAEMVRNSLPPLKQLQAGITHGDINCRNDNQLMFREYNSVACVKQSSVLAMLDKGWIHVDNQEYLEFKSALPTIWLDAPRQIDDSTILEFVVEIMDFVENNSRPIITITDENQNMIWTGQHNVPFDAGWIPFAGSGYRIQYAMNDYPEDVILDAGTYLLSISLDNQKITKKLTVIKSESENTLRPSGKPSMPPVLISTNGTGHVALWSNSFLSVEVMCPDDKPHPVNYQILFDKIPYNTIVHGVQHVDGIRDHVEYFGFVFDFENPTNESESAIIQVNCDFTPEPRTEPEQEPAFPLGYLRISQNDMFCWTEWYMQTTFIDEEKLVSSIRSTISMFGSDFDIPNREITISHNEEETIISIGGSWTKDKVHHEKLTSVVKNYIDDSELIRDDIVSCT